MKPLFKIFIAYLLLILSVSSFFLAGFHHKFIPYNCGEPRIYPFNTVLICLLIGVLSFVLGLFFIKEINPGKRLAVQLTGVALMMGSSGIFFLAGVYYTDMVYSCDPVYFPIISVVIAMFIGSGGYILGLILLQKSQSHTC